jgi:sigma-B regulation protein RsbU (phosphoserine phosphatase)
LTESGPVSASAVRVLIADDEAIARRMLEHAVEQAGYAATVVATGDEAWRALRGADGPLVAVLDWMMPGLTGLEVCEKVRAAGLRPSPYLIVLTSRGAPDDVVRALQTGADDHITKPFEPGELRARLAVGARLVALQQELADRVRALEDALAHVQQLQGLIPICAWCRQVRSDGDFWVQVDDYLARRSGLQFTHAICPTCRERELQDVRKGTGND